MGLTQSNVAFGSNKFWLLFFLLVAVVFAGLDSAHAQSKATGYKPSDDVKSFLKKKWSPKPSFAEQARVTAFKSLTQAPPGFPVPVYSGVIKGGFERHSSLGKMTDFRIETRDPVGTVTSWYTQALKSSGWSVNQKMPRPGKRTGQMSGYKDGKVCRVSIAHDSKGGSLIGISLVEHE